MVGASVDRKVGLRVLDSAAQLVDKAELPLAGCWDWTQAALSGLGSAEKMVERLDSSMAATSVD